MYESFFGMEHTPFVRDVPPEKLFESNAFRETLGRLAYVADRQMFAVVTADSGCGKSTLIRRFYSELPKEDYIILYLSDSKLTPRWFYKGLLDQLGLESRFYRGDSKRQLQQEIEVIRGVQRKKVVCILDEAHLLEKETLEEFRFLLNYRFDSMSPMALVLVGQTELWENNPKVTGSNPVPAIEEKAIDQESQGLFLFCLNPENIRGSENQKNYSVKSKFQNANPLEIGYDKHFS